LKVHFLEGLSLLEQLFSFLVLDVEVDGEWASLLVADSKPLLESPYYGGYGLLEEDLFAPQKH